MNTWKCVLELNGDRCVAGGSGDALRSAIGRGADLRIYTKVPHNEHVDPGSANAEVVREVSDFRVTYIVEDRWAAGIMNLRMPRTDAMVARWMCDPYTLKLAKSRGVYAVRWFVRI